MQPSSGPLPRPAGTRALPTGSAMPSGAGTHAAMTVARSILLFALAAVAEIGGAWPIRQGVRGTPAGSGSDSVWWRWAAVRV